MTRPRLAIGEEVVLQQCKRMMTMTIPRTPAIFSVLSTFHLISCHSNLWGRAYFSPHFIVRQMRLFMPTWHNQTPGEDTNFVGAWNSFNWGPFFWKKEDKVTNTELETNANIYFDWEKKSQKFTRDLESHDPFFQDMQYQTCYIEMLSDCTPSSLSP